MAEPWGIFQKVLTSCTCISEDDEIISKLLASCLMAQCIHAPKIESQDAVIDSCVLAGYAADFLST